jgi:uncharacterized protein
VNGHTFLSHQPSGTGDELSATKNMNLIHLITVIIMDNGNNGNNGNNGSRNTWSAKTKRIFSSVLPVAKERTGECIDCDACCKLPNVCPFLRSNGNGKSYCAVYIVRPPNCRKYPRTESEWITRDTCGYKFE